jgi:hypothetical protein
MAACAVLLLVLGVALVWQWVKYQNQAREIAMQRGALEQTRQQLRQEAADHQAKIEQLSADLAREKEALAKLEALAAQAEANEPRTLTASITLSTTNDTRGSGKKEVQVKPDTKTIRLILQLPSNDYPLYDVIIKDTARVNVIHLQHQRPRNPSRNAFLIVSATTSQLKINGVYDVRVTASGTNEPVAEYGIKLSATNKK